MLGQHVNLRLSLSAGQPAVTQSKVTSHGACCRLLDDGSNEVVTNSLFTTRFQCAESIHSLCRVLSCQTAFRPPTQQVVAIRNERINFLAQKTTNEYKLRISSEQDAHSESSVEVHHKRHQLQTLKSNLNSEFYDQVVGGELQVGYLGAESETVY